MLQTYIEQYPDLLAGDLIDSESPRHWVLAQREAPLARDESATDWWSVDHILLDQDAIPTFVEVKRSSDTRIRREVIGQMMEHAAHAVMYWPAEKMRVQFEATCERNGEDPIESIARLLALPDDASVADEVESFWARARENLEQGHLRLLFVADVFPPETRRIIEFLNAKMSDVELLAVEIRQFTGEDRPILVPRVYGQSEVTRQLKAGPRQQRIWDEESFFHVLAETSPEAVPVARCILEWAKERMPPRWGRGMREGSFSVGLTHEGVWYPAVNVWTDGSIGFPFDHMRTKPPLDDVETRLELLRRFNEIPACH